jgi:hypothetical protein
MTQSLTRIVTKAQLAEGYVIRFADGSIVRRDFLVLGRQDDGTYIVKEPRVDDEPISWTGPK